MITIIMESPSALKWLLRDKNNQLLEILKEGKISFTERRTLYEQILELYKKLTLK